MENHVVSLERWKPIEEYEGLYEVSNFGRIRSLKRNNGLGSRLYTKIMGIKIATDGYRNITLSKNDIGKTLKASRLVAKAFIPNPLKYPQVNHKDGNKINDLSSNLEWCSPKQNMQHAFKMGLRPTGEKHWKSKLTRKQVRKIRELYWYNKSGFSLSKIGVKFGVGKSQIHKIVHNKAWIN